MIARKSMIVCPECRREIAVIGTGRALEPALGATLTVPADWIRDHTTKKSDAE